MTMQTLRYVPPMEPFCIWEGAFTPEECDKIIEVGELVEFQNGLIGERVLDETVRKTAINWLAENEENRFIFERMNNLQASINFHKYQMDLNVFDGFQYSKYKVSGHYRWHIDTILQPEDGEFRKLTFVVVLNDPDAYEGGDLLLATNGNQDNPNVIRGKKGDLIVFYSYVPHKVTPVTKGERYTLVTWAKGPKPR